MSVLRLRHAPALVMMVAGTGLAMADEKQAAVPTSAAAAGVTEVTYKSTEQGNLTMLIHRPEGWKATDRRPAIVFFFGGGWTNGSTRQFESQAAYLAGR